MYKRAKQGWTKHLDFILLDELCLQAAFILAYAIRRPGRPIVYYETIYQTMALFLVLADLFVAATFSTMHNVRKRGLGVEMLQTVKHALLIFGVTVCYMFTLKSSEDYSRVVIYITMGMHVVFGWTARMLWKVLLRKLPLKRRMRAMMVVTSSQTAPAVLEQLRDIENEDFTNCGLVLTDWDGKTAEIGGVPVRSGMDGAVSYIVRNWVDEVLIDPFQRSEAVSTLVAECRKMGITIHEAIALDNAIGNRQYLDKVGGYQVVTSSVNLASPMQLACKRLIDIAAGLAGLVLTGLVLLFVAPKIKKASPGPIFFTQDRVGKNGHIFKFVKIRSMYLDAEERKKELMAQNRVADGMMFKMDFDPRIIGNEILPDGTHKTGIGQFIRNTSLDEFPQFWNVLKGDMSLVGTRPPTVDEWEKYDTHHRARMAMKPGITGMWQVSGRSDITDFEEVVRLDTEYIYNWSLLMDFKIIFKTFAVLFKKEGAM